MSNRRRLRLRDWREDLRVALACPSCSSEVVIDDNDIEVWVRVLHDDDCQRLTQMSTDELTVTYDPLGLGALARFAEETGVAVIATVPITGSS